MWASGSSSDAQIFNRSKLRRKIENRTLGIPPPEPLGPGGESTLLPLGGQRLCPYALVGKALQQKTTDQRRESNQQYIQGTEGGGECLWDTGGKVQGAADNHGAEAKIYVPKVTLNFFLLGCMDFKIFFSGFVCVGI